MSNLASSVADDLVRRHVFENGFVSLWTDSGDHSALAEAIAAVCNTESMAVAIIWYSRNTTDAAALGQQLKILTPELPVCGSSSCGEITPAGLQTGGIVVILLPTRCVDVSVSLVENIDHVGMRQIALCASQAREEFYKVHACNSTNTFALALIDGLSFSEELTTVSLQRGLDDIPLIGGSAGDDLIFDRTDILYDGAVHARAALLVLVRSRLPFRLFTDNNFVPTDTKLVVTRADPGHRIVHELNGQPAATAYAEAIDTTPASLDAVSFAAHALILRIGGENYCRSIQRLNPDDGSLTFFCAIDTGLVLTVARSEGMVRSSRTKIDTIERDIGKLGCLIGFDCIYRKLDAQHRGATTRMESLLRDKHFVGCNTYGEHFHSMHVNQTMTGVAFGCAAP